MKSIEYPWPESSLYAGQGDEGNQFVYSGGKWQFNLKLNKDYAEGTYVVYAKGGADGRTFLNTCTAQFEVQ